MKHRFFQQCFFIIALSVLFLLGFCALTAPKLTGFHPTHQNLEQRFLPPGEKGHILGTDEFGRDVFTRIIYGSRSALLVGITSVSIAFTIGLFVGFIAAFSEGFFDHVLMLLMDSILSFPTVLLAITVITVLGYGLFQVMIAIGIIFSPVFARIVRAETLAIKEEEFIESARALGTPLVKTIFIHIFPNILGKLIVQCSITFALAIVIESSLSFLGLGMQPPNPSWGLMLKNARNYLIQAPWLAFYPGLAIALAVLSFNIIGDVLSEGLKH